jgi:hypothetical protein
MQNCEKADRFAPHTWLCRDLMENRHTLMDTIRSDLFNVCRYYCPQLTVRAVVDGRKAEVPADRDQ